MTDHRSARGTSAVGDASWRTEPTRDVADILGGFTGYLHDLGYAALTIEHYRRRLLAVAAWLQRHRRHCGLRQLTRRLIPHLLQDVLPGRSPDTLTAYRKVLHHWLRFQGRYATPHRAARWQPWLDDYRDFLQTHRGVGPCTLEPAEASVQAFLEWQFGHGPADWARLRPPDIWRFAQHQVRRLNPPSRKVRLGEVRRFLKFVHLKGACSSQLAAAVPTVAVCGNSVRPQVLSEPQRRQMLASFALTSPEGKRDYAMVLCMLDLGLRGAETIRLRLEDIDWQLRQLAVPGTKTGRGRQLPIPEHVFARYCAALDPRTQVPPLHLTQGLESRRAPHIYTDAQVRLIMRRTRTLRAWHTPLRPITYRTLIGLLACTGLRPCEALRLRDEHLDATAGTLRVPPAKSSAGRTLPLHRSAVRALQRYQRIRRAQFPFAPQFFAGPFGRHLVDVCGLVDVPAPGSRCPRQWRPSASPPL